MSIFDDNMQHVLVLQGGGALGAYQGGAFESMAKEGYRPNYVAGISIGAINAALVAGNRPEHRVEAMRTFWTRVTQGESATNAWSSMFAPYVGRGMINDFHAAQAMFVGVRGFYRPRQPAPFFQPSGSPEALSFYDTAPLRDTLLELVDFDYLNAGAVRLAVGAVNIETGNQVYFDNSRIEIRPEHIMASGALPPGFPPVEIDGQFYWDGGIVSNTPLQYVLDNHDSNRDMAIFQFDLFSARGHMPRTIADIESREKDIRFSSRTRYSSDQIAQLLKTRAAMAALYDKLPKELQDSPEAQILMEAHHSGRVLLIHMIYHQANYERASKDYEFSRRSMQDHWSDGARDATRTISHADEIKVQFEKSPLTVLDFSRTLEVSGLNSAISAL